MNPICMSKHPSRNNTWCNRALDHVGPHRDSGGFTWDSPAESYTRTESPDLMDGGVTSALVEEEAEECSAERPRALTPDDITDRFVDHVHEDYFWSTEERVRLDKRALRDALRDAVKRSQEPTRPEGAEEIEADMAAWYGENGIPVGGTGDRLADHLAALGYRKADS